MRRLAGLGLSTLALSVGACSSAPQQPSEVPHGEDRGQPTTPPVAQGPRVPREADSPTRSDEAGRDVPTTDTKAPKIAVEGLWVSGPVPPDVIQSGTKGNLEQVRACYERGLARSPTLNGRIEVRFVINREGVASIVGNGGSTLPDEGVVLCVVNTFAGLKFPNPERSATAVKYPIVFTPN